MQQSTRPCAVIPWVLIPFSFLNKLLQFMYVPICDPHLWLTFTLRWNLHQLFLLGLDQVTPACRMEVTIEKSVASETTQILKACIWNQASKYDSNYRAQSMRHLLELFRRHWKEHFGGKGVWEEMNIREPFACWCGYSSLKFIEPASVLWGWETKSFQMFIANMVFRCSSWTPIELSKLILFHWICHVAPSWSIYDRERNRTIFCSFLFYL